MTTVFVVKTTEWIKAHLRRLSNVVVYYGKGRFCPVCGKSSRRFRSYGIIQRKEAQCVHCGSLERHRLLWLFVTRKTDLLDGRPKTMLHVAPEKCFESILRGRLGDGYIAADIAASDGVIKMDITNINWPDGSFDVIYCSHVLEHVKDDKKAMREMCRTLKHSGWAIMQVPIATKVTFEDPATVDPAERLKVYGHHDHVRNYGEDIADRLCDAGFKVMVINGSDFIAKRDKLSMGITGASGKIYFCRPKAIPE